LNTPQLLWGLGEKFGNDDSYALDSEIFGKNKVVFNSPSGGSLTDASAAYKSADVKIPWDQSFSTKKEVATDDAKTDISAMTLDALKEKEFNYTITFSPNSSDTANYYGNTFTITDVLPEGMAYVDGSATVNDKATLGTVKQSGRNLSIQLTSKVQLSGWSSDTITVTYKTKLKAAKAEELLTSTELFNSENKSVAFPNTISRVLVTNGNGDVVKDKQPNATATVTFEKKTPAPGFAKLAAASFPGQVYDKELLQPVNEGFITAGDTLIWHAVVYNGKGETDADLATLKNYTITDTLPNNYQYDRTTGFTARAVKYTYTQTGYSVDPTTGLPTDVVDSTTGLLTGGAEVALPKGTYDPTTNTITWELNGDDFALGTNDLLVIEFSTVVKEGMEKDGTITNTGYATFDQAFSVQDVVAGEANGKEIHNYANYNIVGLTTESWKTITYTSQGHTVATNGHDDPPTDTGTAGSLPTIMYRVCRQKMCSIN